MQARTAARAWSQWREADHGARVSWGWPCLQAALGDILPGSLVVVGAATNMGKTFFKLGMAARQPTKSLFVSCEDPLPEVGRRLELLPSAALDNIVLSVPENPYLSRVLDDMTEAAKLHGVRCAFVDYLQVLMYDGTQPNGSRLECVRNNVQALKSRARGLGIPVVLGSQLRRPQQGDGSRPTMHWLKESGDIENMAETIILLSSVDSTTVRVEVAKSKTSAAGLEFFMKRHKGGVLEEMTELFDTGGAA